MSNRGKIFTFIMTIIIVVAVTLASSVGCKVKSEVYNVDGILIEINLHTPQKHDVSWYYSIVVENSIYKIAYYDVDYRKSKDIVSGMVIGWRYHIILIKGKEFHINQAILIDKCGVQN